MPVETIKCQECGSADVTEFKTGSYVCGHCEAVFKHVPHAWTALGCQMDDCGVLAVGRCRVCKRAFCGTHQARDYEGPSAGIPRSDVCMACAVEARRAAQARAARTAATTRGEDPRSRAIKAAALLMDAGGPGLQHRIGIRHEPSRWSPLWSSLMGRRVLRPVEIALEPAWPVGRYGWFLRSEIIETLDTGFTPNGEIVPMGGPNSREGAKRHSGGAVAECLVLPPGAAPHEYFDSERGDGTWRGPTCSWGQVAVAMEQLIIRELGANSGASNAAEHKSEMRIEPA